MIDNLEAWKISEQQKKILADYFEAAGKKVDRSEFYTKADLLVEDILIELKYSSSKYPGSVTIKQNQLVPKLGGYVICSVPMNGTFEDGILTNVIFKRSFIRNYLAITENDREKKIWMGDDGDPFRVFEFQKQAHNGMSLQEFLKII